MVVLERIGEGIDGARQAVHLGPHRPGGDPRFVNLGSEGDQLLVTLEPVADCGRERLLALDGALDRLQERDPQLAELVELRFFGGQSVDVCARILGVGERQAYRWWKTAKLVLKQELER